MALPELSFEQARGIREMQLTHQGWLLGLRHALGLLLEANNLTLSKEQEEQIKSAFGTQLRYWIQRAAKAASTDDLFFVDPEIWFEFECVTPSPSPDRRA